jgi:hypothetical protein
MREWMTIISAWMTAGENTSIALLFATTRKHFVKFHTLVDTSNLAVSTASQWQTTVNVKLSVLAHESHEWIPERLSANNTLPAFRSDQSERITEYVETSTSSRQSDDQSILVIKKADTELAVAANQ